MKYIKDITRILVVGLFAVSSFASAMNVTRPYDSFVRAELLSDYRVQLKALGQFSFSDSKGYNEDGCRVNVLRIWNEDQNALKMLDGFDNASAIGQMRIHINANDDGVRGHYLVDGCFSNHGLAFSGRVALPNDFSIVAHVPFYFMQLKNVKWYEQTKNVTPDDLLTKKYLTNDFFANVCELGDGLNIGDWKRYGIGDVSLLCEWMRDFKQDKQFLKNVRLNTRAGLGLPTGKPRGEDNIFALPFGQDRATFFVFGAGLDLNFRAYMKAGFDVELTHIFGNDRCRRIKTNEDQTELLLLKKVNAYKDFGLSQRFNLYLQAYKFWGGFSCMAGYQFFRHGDDTLCLKGYEFSETIANTAKSLEEWTMHNMFFNVSYDFKKAEDSRVHPYFSAFVRIPFNGKFCAMTNAIGFVASIDF